MKKKLRLHSFLRKIMRFTATQMVLVVLFCISAYANNANGQDVLDKNQPNRLIFTKAPINWELIVINLNFQTES